MMRACHFREASALPQLSRLSAAVLLATALVGCQAASARNTGSASVVGDGFELVLPAGWTSSPPQQSNGFTTYVLQSNIGGFDISVATLPIPDDPTNPQVAAIMDDDIVTVALTINGTEDVQPTLTESAHVVTFVGTPCARMGLAIGGAGDSRIITCRRGGVIYDMSVSSASGSAGLLSTLDDIASGWSWT